MAAKDAPTVTEDEEDDFVETAPKKPAGKPANKPAAAAPKEVIEEVETPEEPVKPRFPQRLLNAAEEWGLSNEDIEGCETAQDLKDLIKIEVDLAHERRARQMGPSGAGRDGSRAVDAAAPEVPAPTAGGKSATPEPTVEESEWKFLEDLDAQGYDPKILAEMKRFGKELLGLRKNTSQEKLDALQKKFDEQQAILQQLAARNNPVVQRAQKTVAKYASLFGDDFDDNGLPPEGTDERERYDMLVAKVRRMHESGKGTGVPEKDIPAAIAALWPGVSPGAASSNPEPAPTPPRKAAPVAPVKPKGTTRADEWNDSGQAPAVNRNGADRSGVPSDKEATAVVAKKLKERGINPGPASSEEDDLDDF